MIPIALFIVVFAAQLLTVSESSLQCHDISKDICNCISNCSFSTLEEAMKTDENQYKLWTTFHHPRKPLPQWLVVCYILNSSSYDGCHDNGTYLWTSNSIYFVVPPQVFGLLSLFLGVFDDDHAGSVTLTIPENCSCWLDVAYQTEIERAIFNYLQVLTEKLRFYGHVKSFPESVATYKYQSSAIKKDNVNSFQMDKRKIMTFFSFMVGLPFLATIGFFIIVLSRRNKIEKSLKDPKQHKTYAALIGLGATIAWFATTIDILAFKSNHRISEYLFFSKENNVNEMLRPFLIISISLELLVIAVFDVLPLVNGCVCLGGICHVTMTAYCIYRGYNDIDRNPQERKKVRFWTFVLPFIPPLWCLSSRFGFIVVAWTSFIRHSSAFTVFYIFAISVMFVILSHTYILIMRCWYKYIYGLNDKKQIKEMMGRHGLSIPAIWVIRFVGAILVLNFAYLMFGLWLLPVPEVVEDAPNYLNDALQLIFIVLAALISYELFAIKKPKAKSNP